MKELVIAPSILSLDYSRTSEQLKELDEDVYKRQPPTYIHTNAIYKTPKRNKNIF